MRVIAAPPPAFDPAEVERLLEDRYRLTGELRPLVSERDQNFRLTAANNQSYVVKIANPAEDRVVTDFQVQALRHLEENRCPVAVPRIVPAHDGSAVTYIGDKGVRHIVRVMTYVPGTPLEGDAPDTRLGRELGKTLATVDHALRDFAHPGDHQDLLWDMQRATDVRRLVRYVPEPELRSVAHRCLDDFENLAMPAFASLRRQVIHNDLNPGNVLVSDETPATVAGVIDFGDMLRAPLVVDVAIAASYLRAGGDDALGPAISLAAGFDLVTALHDLEIALLYDLVRTRLVTTIAIMYWRKSVRPDDDAYLRQAYSNERDSERFLQRLNAVSREHFAARVRATCAANRA